MGLNPATIDVDKCQTYFCICPYRYFWDGFALDWSPLRNCVITMVRITKPYKNFPCQKTDTISPREKKYIKKKTRSSRECYKLKHKPSSVSFSVSLYSSVTVLGLSSYPNQDKIKQPLSVFFFSGTWTNNKIQEVFTGVHTRNSGQRQIFQKLHLFLMYFEQLVFHDSMLHY